LRLFFDSKPPAIASAQTAQTEWPRAWSNFGIEWLTPEPKKVRSNETPAYGEFDIWNHTRFSSFRTHSEYLPRTGIARRPCHINCGSSSAELFTHRQLQYIYIIYIYIYILGVPPGGECPPRYGAPPGGQVLHITYLQ